MISYTIAKSAETVTTDLLFESKSDLLNWHEGHPPLKTFRFEWDGRDVKSIKNITEV